MSATAGLMLLSWRHSRAGDSAALPEFDGQRQKFAVNFLEILAPAEQTGPETLATSERQSHGVVRIRLA